MGEGELDDFDTLAHGALANPRSQADANVVHRHPDVPVAEPTGEFLAPQLGEPRLPGAAANVAVIVVVSPLSAGCTSATTTPTASAPGPQHVAACRPMGGAVFHAGAAGTVIGLRNPLLVGRLLALALAVQADQVLGGRRLDPTFFRHAPAHLAVVLAGGAAPRWFPCKSI